MYDDCFKLDESLFCIIGMNPQEFKILEQNMLELIDLNTYIPRSDYLRISRLLFSYFLNHLEKYEKISPLTNNSNYLEISDILRLVI